uniref:Uncharacterized protein n=1 Tax=Cryptomonas curvata TaxID=233186 RepID=A0A7S0QXH8_9CRYP
MMSPKTYLLICSILLITIFSSAVQHVGPVTAGRVSYVECLTKARQFSKGDKAYQLAGDFLEAELDRERTTTTLLNTLVGEMNNTLQAKDKLLDEIQNSRNKLESEFLFSLALGQPVVANRMTLEGALRAYRMSLTTLPPESLKTTTEQYGDFRDKFLLDASNTYMRRDCIKLNLDLSALGIVAALPDVKNELKDLFRTLSGHVHYRNPLPTIPGIYIGGDQPTTSALAICMARLQGEHHCDLELYVLDAHGDPKCKLVGGKVHTL